MVKTSNVFQLKTLWYFIERDYDWDMYCYVYRDVVQF